MSTAWRQHFSYNKAIQIASRALRASLKEESRVAAEKRGVTLVRYQKWENGSGGEQTYFVAEEAPSGGPPKSAAV